MRRKEVEEILIVSTILLQLLLENRLGAKLHRNSSFDSLDQSVLLVITKSTTRNASPIDSFNLNSLQWLRPQPKRSILMTIPSRKLIYRPRLLTARLSLKLTNSQNQFSFSIYQKVNIFGNFRV